MLVHVIPPPPHLSGQSIKPVSLWHSAGPIPATYKYIYIVGVEFFSTVPSFNFHMCRFSTRIRTHFVFRSTFKVQPRVSSKPASERGWNDASITCYCHFHCTYARLMSPVRRRFLSRSTINAYSLENQGSLLYQYP